MVSMPAVDCVLELKASPGECPMWHVGEQRLYFVDIATRRLYRFDPATGAHEVRQFDQALGSFGFRASGGLVGAFRDDGFCTFDFETGARTQIVNPEPGNDDYRFNDGRVDPYGAFWSGTMHEPIDHADRGAVIYRCGPDGIAEAKVSGLGCSNGIAFDAARKRFYCADTVTRDIWKFDHDPETGAISNRTVFATMDSAEGRPDGACLDAEGCYWSAAVGGWQMIRYTPDGKVDRTIRLPVEKPTMCAFGGADLDIMYITSIGPNMASPRPMAPGQPQAGSLFACRVPGVSGVPEPVFAG